MKSPHRRCAMWWFIRMVIPLFVGREKSIRCLEAAMDHDKKIMLVAQKEASTDEPGAATFSPSGPWPHIADAEAADGTVKVLVEGLQRARNSALSDNGRTLFCEGGVSGVADH
ncbi:LON peptidase substrate-binding domain-containing protein [Shigella flexneri]